MTVEFWDQETAKATGRGRCKGFFFASFRHNHFFRRCIAATDKNLCDLCAKIRETASSERESLISVEKIQEYAIVSKAVLSRPGTKENMEYWTRAGKEKRENFSLPAGYPYFSAQEMASMLLMDTKVIFPDGGKGGRVYKRSEMIVNAQDEFVRTCMNNILAILRFEDKKHFKQRWRLLKSVASKVHDQMLSAATCSPAVGALQAPDIFQEELTRAAREAVSSGSKAKFTQPVVRELGDWASLQAATNESLSDGSISSTAKTPQMSKTPGEVAKQLEFAKVTPPAGPSSARATPARSDAQPARAGGLGVVVRASPSTRRVVESGQSEKRTEARSGTPKHVSATESSGDDLDRANVAKPSEPACKRHCIKRSEISGAGEGLFLLESASHGEQIARYSGVVLTREQAMQSASKYIVEVSHDVYLDGGGEGHWEGNKMNCARKARLTVNARISAGAYRTCPVTGKHWLPVFAVGTIHPHDEVMVDYGRAYWRRPEEAEESFGTPAMNTPSESSGDGDRVSDSDYAPSSGSGNSAAPPAQLASGVHQSDESSNDGDRSSGSDATLSGDDRRKAPGNRERFPRRADPAPPRKVQQQRPSRRGKSQRGNSTKSKDRSVGSAKLYYAVAKGRCVGIFKSATRVADCTFGFSDNEVKKCASVQEATEFLQQKGIDWPRIYWTTTYESGSLLAAPQSVVGRKAYFPVGRATSFYEDAGVSSVTSTRIENDRRVWTVTMHDGYRDTMTEWPLLCGLAQYAAMHGSATRQVYAVRGTAHDGVITDLAQVPARLTADAELREFSSVHEAEAWVRAREPERTHSKFYGIRGGTHDGVVTSLAEVAQRMIGSSAAVEEFTSKVAAEAWVREINFFAVRFLSGEARVVSASALMATMRGKTGVTCVGPKSREEAEKQVSAWTREARPASSSQPAAATQPSSADMVSSSGCIARMRDGSLCGRSHGMRLTALGMLCGEHAVLCVEAPSGSRHDSAEGSAVGRRVSGDVRRHACDAPISGLRDRPTTPPKDRSPDVGIRMPKSSEVMRRFKSGAYVVIAVRTFPDSNCPAEPAGSIWLSNKLANEANERGGQVEVFASHKNIFDNIADAREWIEAQGSDDADDSAEFERLMQEARDKRRATGRASTSARGNAASVGSGAAPMPTQTTASDVSSGDVGPIAGRQDDPSHAGAPGSRFRRRQRVDGTRGRGLRSGATVMLDKQQSRVKKQMFYAKAEPVWIYDFDVPVWRLIEKIPLPGETGALTTAEATPTYIALGNGMKAELAEKSFKSFRAFSLSELLEFQEVVEYVADTQQSVSADVADSVVAGMRVICKNAIQVHSSMRDSGSLGPNGENFKAYTYIQVMYLVMYREVFMGALAEMFFWSYAPKFAIKARGCLGMGPRPPVKQASAPAKSHGSDRCLVCGKAGHRADSDVHAREIAEGRLTYSKSQLRCALAEVNGDDSLSAERKRHWTGRITKYWEKAGSGAKASEST